MSFDIRKIQSAVIGAKGIKIAVAGDFCLDKYLYIDGGLDEPSLETGLTAYQVTRRALFAGAAGTIANNLAALGAKVVCAGFIGEDGEGWELERCLLAIGADTSLMIKTPLVCTPTYVKPMYCGGEAAPRELNRLDLRNFTQTPESLEKALIKNTAAALEDSRAMIVCDQFTERNHSAVTDAVRSAFIPLAANFPARLILADSRGFIDLFRAVTVKCNNYEAARVFGYSPSEASRAEVIRDCGAKLAARNGKSAIITCGGEGAWVFGATGEGAQAVYVPSFKVEGPIDICGAGDSFNAGYALGSALGLSPAECLILGNAVASITIRQIGVTGTATPEQVCEVLASYCE